MFRNAAQPASNVAVAGVMESSSSRAASNLMTLTMTNHLTFWTPVSLPGVTLAAGTYVFEAGPGGTNPNIVRVLSPNRQKLFYLGFTVPIVRSPDGEPSVLTFGEAANSAAAPILAWYPVGSNQGHEFLYRH